MTGETHAGSARAGRDGPGWLVAALANGVARLDPGERARLRRQTPGDRLSPGALGLAMRLLVAAGAEERDLAGRRVERFAVLLRLMALVAGTREKADADPHRPGSKDPRFRIGHALRDLLTDGGKREPEQVDARLLAMLAARGEAFDALLERAVRRLAAARVEALDFVALWRLVEWPDGDASEDARLAVARDFYRRAGGGADRSTPGGPTTP